MKWYIQNCFMDWSWVFPVKFPQDESWRTLLMICLHWFKLWIGAIRQQAVTSANVDPDLCHHMASLGHSESKPVSLGSVPKLTYVCNPIQFTVTYQSFTHSSGANCANSSIFWEQILDISFIRLLETIYDMGLSIISYIMLPYINMLFVKVSKGNDNYAWQQYPLWTYEELF